MTALPPSYGADVLRAVAAFVAEEKQARADIKAAEEAASAAADRRALAVEGIVELIGVAGAARVLGASSSGSLQKPRDRAKAIRERERAAAQEDGGEDGDVPAEAAG